MLAMAGVEPVLYSDDPYVGFSTLVPHFVAGELQDGTPALVTAPNKLRLFNRQSFARDKTPNTYRVFCLGGSTTYGRPYGDATSFCGWLRQFLPVADPSRHWEVINGGGISYASYRVALLMEESLAHQPDLFIVYTGHNEFLEQRTYGEILAYPRALRGLGALAGRSRIFAAGQRVIGGGQAKMSDRATTGPAILDHEVRTLLDSSVGPDAYSRDDALREQVLQHYRFSLTRMADMARSAGAEIVFVNPAANLQHSSPFKSEASTSLTPEERMETEELYEEAKARFESDRSSAAELDAVLAMIEKGMALEDRHAHLHYLHGQVLDSLGRYPEAKVAFERARDEDVCPLRALGRTLEIVADVASAAGVPWIDFVSLVEDHSSRGIPGESLFLDHVHPTIEGNRLLALELVEILQREGIVRPVSEWGDEAIQQVTAEVEKGLDPVAHGRALSQLSRVLGWAGKLEESYRLSMQAVEKAPQMADVLHQAALGAHLTERLDEAVLLYRRTVELDPSQATAHSNLAVILDEAGRDHEAADHYRQAISLLSEKNAAYRDRLIEALGKLDL